jgi:hypothetical protein
MASLRNRPETPPALAPQVSEISETVEIVEVDDEPAPPPAPFSPAEPLRALQTGDFAAADPLAGPLEPLGMVELAERFARSIHQRAGSGAPPRHVAALLRGEPGGEPPVEPSAAPSEPAGSAADFAVQPAPLHDPEPVSATFVPPPPVIPAALRPFTFEPDEFGEDEDDDGQLAASFSLPLGRAGPEHPDAADAAEYEGEEDYEEDEEAEEDAEEDDSSSAYSSLLSIRSPARPPAELVPADLPEAPIAAVEPPRPIVSAAPRPFDAPPDAAAQLAQRKPKADPAETERALRSALATLQRMSGAA